MKNTVIPVVCSLALAGMSAAVTSHWWSVLQCVVAVSAVPGAPTLTISMAPAPAPAPPPATLAVAPSADSAPSQAVTPATPPELPKAAAPEPAAQPNLAQATPPTAAQREFYEAMLDEMRQVRKENITLRDQLAETNRDLMKLEFRVDTHSESFRPLPTTPAEPEVAPPVIDDGSGVLPPIPSVSFSERGLRNLLPGLPDPSQPFPLSMTRSSVCSSARGLFLSASLALAGSSGAANLVRNGDFSGGMTDWVKAAEFGADPVFSEAALIFSPSQAFSGAVLSQGLNVTGIAGRTLSATVDLAKLYGPESGSSLSLTVEFTMDDGSRQSHPMVQPANSSYPTDRTSAGFPGEYTFPTGAVKLVKVALLLTGPGSFSADNLVLSGTSLAAGPLPTVTGINPPAAAYLEPFIISGSGFGNERGTIAVAGSADAVKVDSWEDQQVVFHLENPNHGGVVGLEVDGVMANHNLAVGVTSPHYTVTLPLTPVITLRGQPVKLDALVAFHNGFTTGSGVSLTIPGAGGRAVFTPQPIRFQGGACLTFNTTGLSPGIHTFTVESSEGTSTGVSLPLTLDVRLPGSLGLSAWNPSTGTMVPVTGTLVLGGFAAVSTAFTLPDTSGADISASAKLNWTSSDTTVVQVKQTSDKGNGPALYPRKNGTCTLTATGAGVNATFQLTVALAAASGIIDSVAFTNPVSNNSGTGAPNRLTATTTDATTIVFFQTPVDFTRVGEQYGPTGYVDFLVPTGQAPGVYEFFAENSLQVKRSALLDVVNTPGTGLVSGRLVQSFSYPATPAGTLEFHPATGTLISRQISSFGDFVVGDIPPGTYRLRFVPNEPIGVGHLEESWYPNAPNADESLPVTVTANTTTGDLNFFVFKATAAPPAAVSAPEIFGLSRDGETFSLSFATEPGVSYLTEYSDTLDPDSWWLVDEFMGDGAVHTVTDTEATGPSRFYRVMAAVPSTP